MESKPKDEIRRIWSQRVAEWERSGLTAAAFAARSGDFRPQTLKFWKWKFGSEARKRPATAPPRPRREVKFVEITAAGSTSPSRAAAPFDLEVGRFHVRLAPDFDADALRTLIATLEGA